MLFQLEYSHRDRDIVRCLVRFALGSHFLAGAGGEGEKSLGFKLILCLESRPLCVDGVAVCGFQCKECIASYSL